MAEYIVKIDRPENVYVKNGGNDWMDKATRIVRCRDCKYLVPENDEHENQCGSPQWEGYAGLLSDVDLNGFCSWGKPKAVR